MKRMSAARPSLRLMMGILFLCAGILTGCLNVAGPPMPTYAALAPTVSPLLPSPDNSLAAAPTASTPAAASTISLPTFTPVRVDCSPQTSQRTQVISYTVAAGEDLACIAAKFGLPLQTLRGANTGIITHNALLPATTLIIPPAAGALYILRDEDIAENVTLRHLAEWYGLIDPETIVDWTGLPAIEPLHIGQRVFLPGADPFQKPFTVRLLSMTPLVSALPTAADLWQRYGQYDTGFCPLVEGIGRPGPPIWPIDNREIRQNRGFRPGHTGIDILAEPGTPIYATLSGTIIWAGFSATGAGNLIILAHGDGWQTIYAHLSQVLVHCRQQVEQGDIIGYSGESVADNEPHLHFEIRRGRYSFDPLLWLR